MKTENIVKEVSINAPKERVWRAITNKEEMKHWYFEVSGFNPVVGFEFSFTGGSETKQYMHLCKITEVVEGQKIAYSWCYDGYEGYSVVTFELFAEGNATKLRLTHEGVDSFPADNSDFARENFNMGWEEIIKTSIKNYMEEQSAYL